MSSSSPLPRLNPPKPTLITLEPLLPSTFSPFGTAIHSPLPRHLCSIPTDPPSPTVRVHTPPPSPPLPPPPHQPTPQPANQNTALKTSPISPLTNNYPPPSLDSNYAESKGLMSIFSCFPRQNIYTVDDDDGNVKRRRRLLRIDILERHPYTTQTFCPFNFSSSSSSSSSRPTYFLVVVAPTIVSSSPGSNCDPRNPPDLTKVRAFYAPITVDGGLGVAVTYHPGTWHAPMVVLGERRVDFLVSQFANGVGMDDCQEILIGEGGKAESDRRAKKVVEVDLTDLALDDQDTRLWRAKL